MADHLRCTGNRAATFPLQLLGWEVDVVNTVQFSNHTGGLCASLQAASCARLCTLDLLLHSLTGYGRWGGLRFDEAHLDDLFAHLDQNGLLRYSRVLTGALFRLTICASLPGLKHFPPRSAANAMLASVSQATCPHLRHLAPSRTSLHGCARSIQSSSTFSTRSWVIRTGACMSTRRSCPFTRRCSHYPLWCAQTSLKLSECRSVLRVGEGG